jgi:translocation and assembly module TamB
MDVRRRLVLVISALLMFCLCAGVVGGFIVLTQGARGRAFLREGAEFAIGLAVRGRVHLGTLDGTFVTDLTVDSLEIRDLQDGALITTGPIRVTFDPRDLLDGQILIRSVSLARPRLDLREDSTGVWNIVRTFPPAETPTKHRDRGAFANLIVLELVTVRDGAVRIARADTTTAPLEWVAIDADVPRLRLAHPDSLGITLTLARVSLEERSLPLTVRELGGSVRVGTDSLWLDFPRVRLAHSRARVSGFLAWGDSMPRIRIRIDGDSIGFGDLRPFSEYVPTEGYARGVVELREATDAAGGMQVVLSALEARARGSRVRGGLTVVVGAGDPIVRDIDLMAAPIDLALVSAIAGTALPVDGTLTGRLRAAGGPLDRLVVDRAAFTFRDRRVDGAVSSVQLRGAFDLSRPATPVFRGVTVRLDSLDLRTLHAIDSTMPRLAGQVVASVRLDSTLRALRFRDLDLVHRDGEATPSQLVGSGRLTLGTVPSIDASLMVTPLALGTLARSFPEVPLRDTYSGAIRLVGRADSLAVTTQLEGASGRLDATLILDAQAPLYRVTAQTTVTDFRPRLAFADTTLPAGVVSFRLTTDLGGDSLPDLMGEAAVDLTRSQIEGIRIFGGRARLRFGDGAMMIDTVSLESTALDLSAAGALGLHAPVRDSVLVRVRIDSLGGLRRWITSEASDSIAGSLRLDGVADGWIGDFTVRTALDGEGLLLAGSTARRITGRLTVLDLPRRPMGTLSFGADTVGAGGLGFSRTFARATLDSSGVTQLDLQMTGTSGTLARAQGRITPQEGATRFGLDSLVIATGLQRWALAAGAQIIRRADGLTLDPIVIRGGSGAELRVEGVLPADGPIGLRAVARQVPVADLAELLQVSGTQQGLLDLEAELRGSRAAPQLAARATVREALIAGVRIDSLAATAQGDAQGMRLTARLGRRATPDLRAEADLPIRLRFDGRDGGVAAEAPLRVTVRSDSVSLRLFDLYTAPKATDPGSFALNLDVGGTWAEPRVDGGLIVRNGNLLLTPLGDVTWRDVTADIALIGDSIAIRRVSAASRSDGQNGRGSIAGWLTFADRENPRFDVSVRAKGFHVYNVRGVADVDVSDSLRLAGSLAAATLTGGLTVERALVTIPEVATKNVVSLEAFDRFGAADSSATAQRLLPARSSTFIDNLQIRNVPVRMGRDVRLFSKDEANIFLAGAVNITRSRADRGRASAETQLALTGALQTVRGTYTLNLGPVSRKFELERGEVEFFGEPELNPTLDIAAIHTIRQYSKQGSQPDVRIRVQIGGTLLTPSLALSTPDSARVKNADLISYLVTGGPSFEIGAEPTDYTSTAARVLIGSLGGFLSGKAAGGLCDDAVLSTSSADQKQKGLANVGSSVLEGMRFNCAKAINDNTFVRLDAGLCQVGQFVSGGGMGTAASLANSIGVKLDYIIRPQLTLSAGVEPPTSAVLCAQNVSARGFVPTPQQWGVDLFWAWRF